MTNTLTLERATTIAEKFSSKRIVVLGDLMLDEFIWGRVSRISPEAPVPVVEVHRQSQALGGAGNVVSNLKALGAAAVPVGVVGDDDHAARLRGAFAELSISTTRLIIDPSRPTTVKTRIIAHNQQVVRTDRENRAPVSAAIEDLVGDCFQEELDHADAVVVSDYGKGLLTHGLLSRALGLARARGLTVCVDPKMRNFDSYQPVTVITPNNQEAAAAAGIAIDDHESLVLAGRRLLDSIDTSAVRGPIAARTASGSTRPPSPTGSSVTEHPSCSASARAVSSTAGCSITHVTR